RVGEPALLERARGIQEPEGLGQLLEDVEIVGGEAHARARSKGWRAMGTTKRPSGFAPTPIGTSREPSRSRPAAPATLVTPSSTIRHAKATRFSPHASTTTPGPRGRAPIAARRPAGASGVPTTKDTWTKAGRVWSHETGIETAITPGPKRATTFAVSTSSARSPSRQRTEPGGSDESGSNPAATAAAGGKSCAASAGLRWIVPTTVPGGTGSGGRRSGQRALICSRSRLHSSEMGAGGMGGSGLRKSFV